MKHDNQEPLRAPRPQPRWSSPDPESSSGGTLLTVVLLVGVFAAGAVWSHRQIQQAEARVLASLGEGSTAGLQVAELRIDVGQALQAARNATTAAEAADLAKRVDQAIAALAPALNEDAHTTLTAAWRSGRRAAESLKENREREETQERQAWEAVMAAANQLEGSLLPKVQPSTPQFAAKLRLLSSIQAGVWHAAALGTSTSRAVRHQLEAQLAEFDSALVALRKLNLTPTEVGDVERFETEWQESVRRLRAVARARNAVEEAEQRLDRAAASIHQWFAAQRADAP